VAAFAIRTSFYAFNKNVTVILIRITHYDLSRNADASWTLRVPHRSRCRIRRAQLVRV